MSNDAMAEGREREGTMIIKPGRYVAAHSGPIVVFVIGMRINHLLKIAKWLPVARAMGPMLRELTATSDSGLLGYEQMLGGLRTILVLQYWRDFDSLEAYASSRDGLHRPAWRAFNRAIGDSGSVGIFHETYCVEAGRYETIYGNMPPWGLGKVAGTQLVPGLRSAARERMRTTVVEN